MFRRGLPGGGMDIMRSRLLPPRFSGGLHDARTATVIGRWLGPAFAVCFVTGLISHLMQHPPGWLADGVPSRPVWGYRLTQGLHVASGIAAIPLLTAKLWAVYPRLFTWPPVRSVRHALERLSVAPLVAGAVFEVATGLLNIAQWALTLVALPPLLRPGPRANPSVLPLDYPRNWLITLAAVAAVTVVYAAARAVLRARRGDVRGQ